jgi:hypothetical protein
MVLLDETVVLQESKPQAPCLKLDALSHEVLVLGSQSEAASDELVLAANIPSYCSPYLSLP